MMFRRSILAGLAAALALFALAVALKTPRHDRDWVDHLAATPDVTWSADGGTVTIGPVRDWQYLPIDDGIAILEVYRPEARYRLEALEAVYFIEEPHPGLKLMAHTFVVFDFGADGMAGLTIEARKTEDETYSPLRGALNSYELLYVWAEPRDLLTRRAVLLDRELRAYRLELTPEQRVAYFRSLAERTAAIAGRPRFYNTLRSNCTNELAKAAGLGWDPAFILTGGAAEALFKRGLIDGERFDAVRERAAIAEILRRRKSWTVEAFNARLRRHVEGKPEAP